MKTLKIPVPDTWVHIIKSKNPKKYLEDFCKSHPGFDPPNHDFNAVCCHNYPLYGSQHWLIFGHNPTPRTIAHESMHVVDHMCERFGINDKEFRAYMIGYLVEQILKK